MRRLFITEKPNALKALRPHLQAGDLAETAFGHLLEPMSPEELDGSLVFENTDALPFFFKDLPCRPAPKAEKQLKKFGQLLKKVDVAVVATDPGREGSLIGWEILNWHNFKGRVDRLYLDAFEDEAIQESMARMAANPRSGDEDYRAFLEARARQIIDWHWGMVGSRISTSVLRPAVWPKVWSVGGVQTPTVAMLANQERKIRDFVPRAFYHLRVRMKNESGLEIDLWHEDANSRIFDKQFALQLIDHFNKWDGCFSVKTAQKNVKPPKLFNLNSLQRRCAEDFGWTPTKTEKVLDKGLYDKGFATYPRSEGNYLLDASIGNAPDVLRAIGQSFPAIGNFVDPDNCEIRRGFTYKSTRSEHYAIVPTKKPAEGLDGDALKLYELLSRFFVAHHMPDAKEEVVTVSVDLVVGETRRFKGQTKVMVSPGWRTALPDDCPNDVVDSHGKLTAFGDGEVATPVGIGIKESRTNPPPRFTLGGLPEAMADLISYVDDPQQKAALHNPFKPDEPKGLGTVSSRKDIIPMLAKREYVVAPSGKKNPPLKVTDNGMLFIEALERVGSPLARPVARAVLEIDLAAIFNAPDRSEADRRYDATLEKAFGQVNDFVSAVREHGQMPFDGTVPPSKKAIEAARRSAADKGIDLRSSYPGYRTDKTVLDRFFEDHPRDDNPSPKQAGLSEKMEKVLGIPRPERCESDWRICKAYIDENIDAYKTFLDENKEPPSAKALAFAVKLAGAEGVPDEVRTDKRACSAFIKKNKGKKPAGGAGRLPPPDLPPPPPTLPVLGNLPPLDEDDDDDY